MIAAPACAAAAGISISTWYDLVRDKDAPQPAFRGNRCTRWSVSEVRAWLVKRASQGLNTDVAREAVERARRAGQAASARRASSTAS